MVERSHPGGYILNPVVFRALRKLENLIDKHMEAIGAQRIAMPALSPSHLWKKTGILLLIFYFDFETFM